VFLTVVPAGFAHEVLRLSVFGGVLALVVGQEVVVVVVALLLSTLVAVVVQVDPPEVPASLHSKFLEFNQMSHIRL
jgi:hypothetical protein